MIVYTGGTFDLLHAGHIDFLRICKMIVGGEQARGEVVVALNKDNFVQKFKGAAPVCSYEEREAVLRACRYVDRVIPNSGNESSKITIETSMPVFPTFIVIGDDWATKDYYKQMGFTKEWLTAKGITLLYVARQRDLSSTAIKGRM
jgi:glycerol-3-phosphate cytidylyltransferase